MVPTALLQLSFARIFGISAGKIEVFPEGAVKNEPIVRTIGGDSSASEHSMCTSGLYFSVRAYRTITLTIVTSEAAWTKTVINGIP